MKETRAPATKAAQFILIGWSDISVCECCGRSDLERTMLVKDLDGNLFHFGAVCGARKLGKSSSSVSQIKASVDKAAESRAFFLARHWATRFIDDMTRAGMPEAAVKRVQQREAEYMQWVTADHSIRDVAHVFYSRIPGERNKPSTHLGGKTLEQWRAERVAQLWGGL